ncbi:MAG: hypothetical protein QN141_11420 [Armatimonadota bacterium]|nr:hypothetical protein [Armatimonadota bacterium]MDR7559083.1 hypothetical protein [Armatimonadota bacterium]
MARLEGAYEQINARLAGVERELAALRAEVSSELSGLRANLGARHRRMDTQFSWLLALILTAILIPLLRDLRF